MDIIEYNENCQSCLRAEVVRLEGELASTKKPKTAIHNRRWQFTEAINTGTTEDPNWVNLDDSDFDSRCQTGHVVAENKYDSITPAEWVLNRGEEPPPAMWASYDSLRKSYRVFESQEAAVTFARETGLSIHLAVVGRD